MTITVVIPLYNKKDTITKALDSVLNQQVLPDEIIVINDGSTDGSEKEVENLNNPLITLVHQENKGVSAARNKGIELAKSEWIAFLDADDEWETNFLTEIKKLINENKGINAIGTNYFHKADNNLFINPVRKIHYIKNNSISNYFNFASFNTPPIWSSAICIKKSTLLKVNGFSENIKSGEDLLLWAKIATTTSWNYINKPLAVFNRNTSTKRIPEYPDLVAKELKYLVKIETNIKTQKSIQKYLAFWYKIRTSQYLYHKDIRFVNELIKMFKYRIFAFHLLKI